MEAILQILELFGGIGSSRKSLINLGIPTKVIDYVEIDEKAVASYNAIFRNELEYKTQSVVNWNLRPDILIHGSPCQDFSIAGRQEGANEGTGTRSSLMWETINIIKQMREWKPRIVIWENVKNVLSKHMRHNFNRYLTEMDKLGYTSNFETLNAMEFGLPQDRDRVFTVSYLDGTMFNFMAMERTEAPHIKHFLEDTEEEKYIVTQPSMLRVINKRPKNFNGFVEIIDTHCKTITTKQMRSPNSGVICLGDGRYRYLTELECWRLQGYDDADFYNALAVHPGREGCLNGALYKQAGNSIPIPIFEAMFKQMI